MNTPNPHTHGTIVVGVDGSPSSEHAVLWAAEEASLQHRTLTLVHTQAHISSMELSYLAMAGIPPRQVQDESMEAAEKIVHRAYQLATDHCAEIAVESVIGYGDPRTELLDMAPMASMLVVGTRGHGPVVGLLLGSVSGALLRHSDTPIAVVRPIAAESEGGVLLAADGSEDSLASVEVGFREASQRQSALTIAHCLWDPLLIRVGWGTVSGSDPEADEARLRIAESVAGMAEKYPDVPVTTLVGRGTYDKFVVDHSSKHDLLVIGRPPLSVGQRLLLNGLTASIAEHAHCPTLVVP